MYQEMFNQPIKFVQVADVSADDKFFPTIPKEPTLIQLLEFMDKNCNIVIQPEGWGTKALSTGISMDAIRNICKHERIYIVRKLVADKLDNQLGTAYDFPYFIPEDKDCQVIREYSTLIGYSDLILYGYFRRHNPAWD